MNAFCCQIAGMATLTIRNVPEDLHARLKEQARRNRRSLNQEVIAELDAIQQVSGERKSTRAEEMIAKANELRRGIKRFMTAEEIDAAKVEGRM